MNSAIFDIPNFDIYMIIGILIFFIILEIGSGVLQSQKRKFGDWIQEFGSYVVLAIIIKPGIVLIVLFLGNSFFAPSAGVISQWSIWLTLPIFLFIDDFMQYWYHRSAHEYPFLWKLHRAHHQAEEMGFFVSYRNASMYYILMPNIWWIAIFTFLGAAKGVAIGLILKQLFIISSHSTVQYDKQLYNSQLLKPLAYIWERLFITPAFHHAHHGKTKLDGISDPNSNFGNMFSIWDQLFGTAHFVHEFPTNYGLENDPKDHWTASYFYPIVASSIPHSELARNHKHIGTTRMEPEEMILEKGKMYLYCQCGLSKNQPLCDSSHHGTKYKPLLFEAKRDGKVKLCNCKRTNSAPFCDNSHLVNIP